MMKSIVRSFVAVVYVLTNVVFANAAESSLWNERRAQAQSRRADAPQLASAAPVIPPNLSAVLDATRPARRSIEAPAAAVSGRGGALAAALARLPASAMQVRDVRPASGECRSAVILIQDVHLNREAQHNVAAALEAIQAAAPAGVRVTVGVEGASGPFDFSQFSALPDPGVTGKVARWYLDNNRIAASSYVGIAGGDKAPVFTGIDDAEAYRENVDAYVSSRARQTEFSDAVDRAQRDIADRKRTALNPELLKFDNLRSANRAGAMSLGAYAEKLAALDGAPGEAVTGFLEAYRLESRLDFGRVEQERRAVVSKLVASLSADEISELVRQSLRYRSGGARYGDFYRYLSDLCRRRGVDLDRSPAFRDYVRYVLLADAVQPQKLFDGVHRMEDRAVDRLARQPVEKELLARGDAAHFAAKLSSFALTPDEWERYVALRSLAPGSPELRKPFEAFYEAAEVRSGRIVENLLAAPAPASFPVRALIVGGFHTPDIARKLSERGCDVAVLQPSLTKLDGFSGTEYLSVFTREKTPLERLVTGERLFLAPAVLLAGTPAGRAVEREELLYTAAVSVPGRHGAVTASVIRRSGLNVVRTEVDGVVVEWATRGQVPRGYQPVPSPMSPPQIDGIPDLVAISPTSARRALTAVFTRPIQVVRNFIVGPRNGAPAAIAADVVETSADRRFYVVDAVSLRFRPGTNPGALRSQIRNALSGALDDAGMVDGWTLSILAALQNENGRVLFLYDAAGVLQGVAQGIVEGSTLRLDHIGVHRRAGPGGGTLLMDVLLAARGVDFVSWLAIDRSPVFYHRYLAARGYRYTVSRGTTFNVSLRERFAPSVRRAILAFVGRLQARSLDVQRRLGDLTAAERASLVTAVPLDSPSAATMGLVQDAAGAALVGPRKVSRPWSTEGLPWEAKRSSLEGSLVNIPDLELWAGSSRRQVVPPSGLAPPDELLADLRTPYRPARSIAIGRRLLGIVTLGLLPVSARDRLTELALSPFIALRGALTIGRRAPPAKIAADVVGANADRTLFVVNGNAYRNRSTTDRDALFREIADAMRAAMSDEETAGNWAEGIEAQMRDPMTEVLLLFDNTGRVRGAMVGTNRRDGYNLEMLAVAQDSRRGGGTLLLDTVFARPDVTRVYWKAMDNSPSFYHSYLARRGYRYTISSRDVMLFSASTREYFPASVRRRVADLAGRLKDRDAEVRAQIAALSSADAPNFVLSLPIRSAWKDAARFERVDPALGALVGPGRIAREWPNAPMPWQNQSDYLRSLLVHIPGLSLWDQNSRGELIAEGDPDYPSEILDRNYAVPSVYRRTRAALGVLTAGRLSIGARDRIAELVVGPAVEIPALLRVAVGAVNGTYERRLNAFLERHDGDADGRRAAGVDRILRVTGWTAVGAAALAFTVTAFAFASGWAGNLDLLAQTGVLLGSSVAAAVVGGLSMLFAAHAVYNLFNPDAVLMADDLRLPVTWPADFLPRVQQLIALHAVANEGGFVAVNGKDFFRALRGQQNIFLAMLTQTDRLAFARLLKVVDTDFYEGRMLDPTYEFAFLFDGAGNVHGGAIARLKTAHASLERLFVDKTVPGSNRGTTLLDAIFDILKTKHSVSDVMFASIGDSFPFYEKYLQRRGISYNTLGSVFFVHFGKPGRESNIVRARTSDGAYELLDGKAYHRELPEGARIDLYAHLADIQIAQALSVAGPALLSLDERLSQNLIGEQEYQDRRAWLLRRYPMDRAALVQAWKTSFAYEPRDIILLYDKKGHILGFVDADHAGTRANMREVAVVEQADSDVLRSTLVATLLDTYRAANMEGVFWTDDFVSPAISHRVLANAPRRDRRLTGFRYSISGTGYGTFQVDFRGDPWLPESRDRIVALADAMAARESQVRAALDALGRTTDLTKLQYRLAPGARQPGDMGFRLDSNGTARVGGKYWERTRPQIELTLSNIPGIELVNQETGQVLVPAGTFSYPEEIAPNGGNAELTTSDTRTLVRTVLLPLTWIVNGAIRLGEKAGLYDFFGRFDLENKWLYGVDKFAALTVAWWKEQFSINLILVNELVDRMKGVPFLRDIESPARSAAWGYNAESLRRPTWIDNVTGLNGYTREWFVSEHDNEDSGLMNFDKVERRLSGLDRILAWTQIGGVLGGLGGIAAAMFFGFSGMPIVPNLAYGAISVLTGVVVGATLIGASAHFIYNVFNIGVPLSTGRTPSLRPDLEAKVVSRRRLEMLLSHVTSNALSGLSVFQLLKAGADNRETNATVAGLMESGAANLVRMAPVFDPDQNAGVDFRVVRQSAGFGETYGIPNTPGFNDLKDAPAISGADVARSADLTEVAAGIRDLARLYRQLTDDLAATGGNLTPEQVTSFQDRGRSIAERYDQLKRSYVAHTDVLAMAARGDQLTDATVDDRSRIARMISHQFGNKLTGALGHLQLLPEESDAADLRERIGRSRAALASLSEFAEHFNPAPSNATVFHKMSDAGSALYVTPDTLGLGDRIPADAPSATAADLSARAGFSEVYAGLRDVLETAGGLLNQVDAKAESMTAADRDGFSGRVGGIYDRLAAVVQGYSRRTEWMRRFVAQEKASANLTTADGKVYAGALDTAGRERLIGRLGEILNRTFGVPVNDVILSDIRSLLTEPDSNIMLLVDGNGVVQGMAGLQARNGEFGLIQVAVDPQSQTRGGGSQLMDSVMDYARRRNATAIRWVASARAATFYHGYLMGRGFRYTVAEYDHFTVNPNAPALNAGEVAELRTFLAGLASRVGRVLAAFRALPADAEMSQVAVTRTDTTTTALRLPAVIRDNNFDRDELENAVAFTPDLSVTIAGKPLVDGDPTLRYPAFIRAPATSNYIASPAAADSVIGMSQDGNLVVDGIAYARSLDAASRAALVAGLGGIRMRAFETGVSRPEAHAAVMSSYLDRPDSDLVLVFDSRRRLQGFAVGAINGRTANLEEIAVDPATRAPNRGTALLDAFMNRMEARGVERVSWQASGLSPAFYHRYLSNAGLRYVVTDTAHFEARPGDRFSEAELAPVRQFAALIGERARRVAAALPAATEPINVGALQFDYPDNGVQPASEANLAFSGGVGYVMSNQPWGRLRSTVATAVAFAPRMSLSNAVSGEVYIAADRFDYPKEIRDDGAALTSIPTLKFGRFLFGPVAQLVTLPVRLLALVRLVDPEAPGTVYRWTVVTIGDRLTKLFLAPPLEQLNLSLIALNDHLGERSPASFAGRVLDGWFGLAGYTREAFLATHSHWSDAMRERRVQALDSVIEWIQEGALIGLIAAIVAVPVYLSSHTGLYPILVGSALLFVSFIVGLSAIFGLASHFLYNAFNLDAALTADAAATPDPLTDLPPAADPKYIRNAERQEAHLRSQHITERLIAPGLEDYERYRSLYGEAREIFDKVLVAAGLDPNAFHLHLADTDDPNASASRDYPVVTLNLGALKLLQRDKVLTKDAIAFILSHEVMHVVQMRSKIDQPLKETEERSIFSGIKNHAENRAWEWEADLGGLQLMDAAGFNVANAPAFFRALRAFMDAKGIDTSSWGSHPDLDERIRRMERRILDRHWRNYLKEAQPFRQVSVNQLGQRTRLRQLHEEAARAVTPRRLMDALGRATNKGELLFVYFIGVHRIPERLRSGTDMFLVQQYLLDRLDAYDGGVAGRQALSQFLLGEINDSLTHKGDHWKYYGPTVERVVRGWSPETSLEALEAGVPDFYFHYIDFEGVNADLSAAREAWRNEYTPTEQNGNRGYRFGIYLDNVVQPAITNIEAEVRAGRFSRTQTTRTLRALFNLREQVRNSDLVGSWDGYRLDETIKTLMWSYLKTPSIVAETTPEDMAVFLMLLDAGFQPYPDYGVTRGGTGDFTSQRAEIDMLKYEFLRNVPADSRRMLEDWLAAHPKMDFGELHALQLPYFRNAGTAAHVAFIRDYLSRHEYTYAYSLLERFEPFVSEEEFETLTRETLALSVTSDSVTDGEIMREIFKRRLAESAGFMTGDAFERSLLATIDSKHRAHVAAASREMKAMFYVIVHGGLPWDSALREWVYANGTPEDRLVLNDLLIPQKDRINRQYQRTIYPNKSLGFARYTLPYALEALWTEIGHPERLTAQDVARSGSRFTAFTDEVGNDELVLFRIQEAPHRHSRATPGQPQLPPDEVVAQFSFLDRLPSDYDAAVALLNARLPDSVYRNYALYLLWIDRILRRELGLTVSNDDAFSLDRLQALLRGLTPADRRRAESAAASFRSSLVGDNTMTNENRAEARDALFRDAKPVDETPLRDQHARERPGYENGLFMTPGGALSQMTLWMSRLFEEDLNPIVTGPQSLELKRAAIVAMFPDKSPERDYWIKLAIDSRQASDTIGGEVAMIGLFESPVLRDAYALPAIERAWDRDPALFSSLDGALGTERNPGIVLRLFPERSSMRDDVLNEIAQHLAKTPEQYAQVYALFADPFENPENLREDDGAEQAMGIDLVRRLIEKESPEDKARFMLWLFQSPDAPNPLPKPYFLIQLETEYHVHWDILKPLLASPNSKRFPEAGRTGQREFLSPLITGRDNVFSDAQARDLFLNGLFDQLIPASATDRDLLKTVFDKVFEFASPFRREEIILNLVQAVSNQKDERGIALSDEVREARSKRLMLEAIGLVGTKISQILARSPSTPAAQREEYAKSESSARRFYKGVVFDLIQKLYPGSFYDHFEEIAEPLGSASIKGVYRAKLKNGPWIALKVKRPEVEKSINEDLTFLRDVLDAVRPAFEARGVAIPKRLLAQVEEIFREELDFKKEAENANTLRRNLLNRPMWKRGIEFVFGWSLAKMFPSSRRAYRFYVPEIYSVVNNTFILEELVKGVPLSKPDELAALGHDPADLRRRSAYEFFRQLFFDRFYHADPKVGHVIVDGDRLTLIDAGASSGIAPSSRAWLLKLIKGLTSRDAAALKALAVSSNARFTADTERQFAERVIDSQDSLTGRAMWFFQVMEDANAEIPSDLWAVFRFLAAGGSLFESTAPAPASLILPGTFNEALRFFARTGVLGRAAEWKVGIYAALRESVSAYRAGFAAAHPTTDATQAAARRFGVVSIWISSFAGAALFAASIALSGLDLGSLSYLAGLASSFWAGGVLMHAGWNLNQVARGTALSPVQRTAVSLVRTRGAIQSGDQALVDAVVAAMPDIENLGVANGLDLRSAAGRALGNQLNAGRRASEVLPALFQLSRAAADGISSVDAAAKPAKGDEAATVNFRVMPDDASPKALEDEARAEAKRRRANPTAAPVVMAVAERTTDQQIARLNRVAPGEVVFVRNDATLNFDLDILKERLKVPAVRRINVFMSQNAQLAPFAMASLEKLDPRVAAIYLVIESALESVAIRMTTQDLSQMAQLKRLIDTQA